MSLLKPYISEEIIIKAYDNINEFNLINKLEDSLKFTKKYETDKYEKELCSRITIITNLFSKFESSYNRSFILGSTDYLRITLREENLEDLIKIDLLELIDKYLSKIHQIYLNLDDNPKTLEDMNLEQLENFFDRLQNFISQELEIIPRLDDENFDLSLFY